MFYHALKIFFQKNISVIGSGRIELRNVSFFMPEYTHQNTDVIQMILGILNIKEIVFKMTTMTGGLILYV